MTTSELSKNNFGELNSECLREDAEDTARIWTTVYRPFIMGGNVNQPISTIVRVLERREMKGIGFFSFKTAKGTLRVCEAQTGGIIADSFEELEENIADCTEKELRSQIDGAEPLSKPTNGLTNEEFFKEYRY